MSRPDNKHPLDYRDARIRREVLIRQRRGIWTPEQVRSLASHFRLRPGMKLLDAGCGHGYAMRTWGQYCLPGGKLVGLDRDKRLLTTAKRFCRKERILDSCRFVEGDIYDLPFGDNTFGLSLAHVVFCHLAEPEKALDELVRVTRPGGCIAVFDNAIGGGAHGSWSSWHEPTVKEQMLQYETRFRWLIGRRKLGFGDMSVGCHLPSWMESRGLRDVGARANERVFWIAPPYRSPEQQVTYRNTRERLCDSAGTRRATRADNRELRAGGCTEGRIKESARQGRQSHRRFKRAMESRTAAFAWSAAFWCIWGFKHKET